MGTLNVDQIGVDGAVVQDVDTTLTSKQKNELLLAALPGATVERYAAERVVLFENQVILKKQVTHLGFPHPEFKKRIQIPNRWVGVHDQAISDGLKPRFVGIYHYKGTTIFVDWDPSTYVRNNLNNSAAHVYTNDLYQAERYGEFSRADRNGNRITSVRADLFARYLVKGYEIENPRLEAFKMFNDDFLDGHSIGAIAALEEMHAIRWPDRFQGEWPGFYLEYRLDSFLRRNHLTDSVQFRKVKRKGEPDFDLAMLIGGQLHHYGDLKASDVKRLESPGNDAKDIARCVADYDRFWYVVYEHETRHARDHGDTATIEWNEWRRDAGHRPQKGYDPLSYARRFKESVRFVEMMILEVNEANFETVLSDFKQGHQPDGAARALKVMIKKRNIDNFLIYRAALPAIG